YLICYFADEISAKPEPDAITQLMKDHNLNRKDLVMVGNSNNDLLCAEATGIDYFALNDLL
ncbi:MAG: haloacid dehalogenase, partial [Sphingobacteriaceae bacterium]